MKRPAIAIATGILTTFFLVPTVKAQSLSDIRGDRAAIEAGYEHLRHDRWELRNDLRHCDYAAAAHERAEMNERRALIAELQADLERDIHHRRHHHRYYDDNIDVY
ncbi:MAG TPA: hypothetical protein VJ728_01050 [Candidatus Binataceae bacterium]|nr:hypothetical protein [Candidatus Binataceae bacterium]